MRSDLRPEAVSARLAALRAMSSLQPVEEGRAEMSPPPRRETFEQAVSRRLSELRALCDLTDWLQGRRSR